MVATGFILLLDEVVSSVPALEIIFRTGGAIRLSGRLGKNIVKGRQVVTKGTRRRSILAVLLMAMLLLAIGGSGQDGRAQKIEKPSDKTAGGSTVAVSDLKAAEMIVLPAPPPGAMVSEIKCGADGNIYVVQNVPVQLGLTGTGSLPISKLSITSKSVTSYSVPSLDRYRHVQRLHFDVGADGHLYALLGALDASPPGREPLVSYFIARYKDDGSGVNSYTKLEDAPDRQLQPSRFAVFRDGNVLVSGTAVEEGKPLRPFVVVMDSSGRFVKYVKVSVGPKAVLRFSGSQDPKGNEPTLPPGEAEAENSDRESGLAITLSSSDRFLSSPDGNIYLLQGIDQPRLYVISSAGEVVRWFDLPVPASGLTPSNIAIAGEDIFVWFARVLGADSGANADADDSGNFISIVNPGTGKVTAVYRLPSDAAGGPACATSADNFLVIGGTQDQQHEQVTRYSPR